MPQFRRVLLAAIATLLAASACVGTIPTIPPINLGSFVPISIPSGLVPPSSVFRSHRRRAHSSLPARCRRRSGSRSPIGRTEARTADFLTGQSLPYTLLIMDNLQIGGIKMVSPGGEDLQIGGSPAYYVNLAGDELYVEKGGKTLLVTAVGQSGIKDQLVAIANLAVQRF